VVLKVQALMLKEVVYQVVQEEVQLITVLEVLETHPQLLHLKVMMVVVILLKMVLQVEVVLVQLV